MLKAISKAFKLIIKKEFEKESECDFSKMCKLELKFQKKLLKIKIENAKIHYVCLNYKKCAKKLLSCFNIYSYAKINPFDKLPEIFNRVSLYEILLSSFYKINCMVINSFHKYFVNQHLFFSI